MKRKLISLAVLTLMISVGTVAPLANAQNNSKNNTRSVATEQNQTQNSAKNNKVQVCERKVAKLELRFKNVAKQGETHLKVFDEISTKVEAYRLKKNLQIANYAAVQSEVATSRAKATAAVNDATEAPKLNCATGDHKQVATRYQAAIKTRNQALKEYKAAVKKQLLMVKNSSTAAEPSQPAEAQEDN